MIRHLYGVFFVIILRLRGSIPMALHINTNNFDEEVLKSDVPVLVDFYADWCGPCQMLAPIIEEISDSDVGVKVCKLDVDSAVPLAMKYNISSIPAIIIFKDGKPAASTVGYQGKASLMRLIEGVLNGSND